MREKLLNSNWLFRTARHNPGPSTGPWRKDGAGCRSHGGIGRAVATLLARLGATTIIAGTCPAKLAGTAAALQKIAPGRIQTQIADLADLGSLRCAAARLCADFEKPDIVSANASVILPRKQRTFTKNGF
ncbi:SDR family NAD(P)-dependent oxidoreductase [Acidocella aquatica]|uniref:SDR family NAD(P)-dependent oxidoreductase n=1 Tax=Acidocella aquatica TaxID=1922313 RepID=UPI0024E0C2C1|nr:SDR family NAD(P)-dependent oxidoreductase [Acidocella aquatica]